MKKGLLGIILIIAVLFCLCSCGSENKGDDDANKPEAISAEDFVFSSPKGDVELNTVFDPDSLGEYDYYEAASCGYSGLDKIYTYSTFEIYTYPDGEKDYVLYIDLLEGAKTNRSIEIGSTLAELTGAYGEGFEKQGQNYIYKLGDKTLSFKVKDDAVAEVEYSYVAK